MIYLIELIIVFELSILNSFDGLNPDFKLMYIYNIYYELKKIVINCN